MVLVIVEVRRLPVVEHAAGEERGDQHLLGGSQAADVDQDDLPLGQVAHDGRADRDAGIGGDRLEADDATGPPLHDLKRVEGDAPVELDIAEAGQVVDGGERKQPGEAFMAFAGVVTLQLEQCLFLRPAPVVRGAEIVDRRARPG